MPRKPVIQSNEHFYHLTARSNNKEFFFISTAEVWDLLTRELTRLQLEYDLKIGACVLMSNHFHLLMLTPNESISRVMFYLMMNLTRKIQQRSGRINKIFGGRYKGSLIENEIYLMNVYKYIYRNPVASSMCERAEDYPFSTLHTGTRSKLKVEQLEFTPLISKTAFVLDWINQNFEKSEADSISTGLRKTKFAFKKNSSNVIIEPKF